MGDNPLYITQFLDSIFGHGPLWVYLAIFAACFIENIVPPFPGDSFILASGGLVAAERLDLYVAFPVVVFGGVSSVMIIYFLGRYYGRDYFLRKNYRYFSSTDIIKVEDHLRRWGPAIIIFSRFIVGFRVAIALGAGIGRYHAAKMFLFSLISYFIFAGLLMYVAIVAVDNFDRVEHVFRTYHRVVWPVVIALAIAYVVHRFRRLRNKT